MGRGIRRDHHDRSSVQQRDAGELTSGLFWATVAPTVRESLASPTPVYCVGAANFTTSTDAAYGFIEAAACGNA